MQIFATMDMGDLWLRELRKGEEVTEIQMRLLQEGLDQLKLQCVDP